MDMGTVETGRGLGRAIRIRWEGDPPGDTSRECWGAVAGSTAAGLLVRAPSTST